MSLGKWYLLRMGGFFTERPGSLRVIENGKLRKAPLLELLAPFVSKGEGGLLGLALDPAFEKADMPTSTIPISIQTAECRTAYCGSRSAAAKRRLTR